VRILIVSFAPLSRRLGAGQLALDLASALRERDHQAVAWALPAPPSTVAWWRHTAWRRRELERHIEREGPFDLVDLPPIALDRNIARLAPSVIRSVQPDWLYFRADWASGERLRGGLLRAAAHFAFELAQQHAPRRGRRLAGRILCLGSVERDWLARHDARVRDKLAAYVVAPSADEQRDLAAIRAERRGRPASGVRFLWIGRWAAHKGTARLVEFLVDRLRDQPADSCTIAGCGSDALPGLPPELLAGGRLQIVPSFSRAELGPLLAEHDAGLFTSVAEGWGLSLNEMLESGLPVYATEAGGVADLRPYFPTGLRPFPPPADDPIDPATDDPEATGYYHRFTWERIAEAYERDLLSASGALERPPEES